MRSDRFLPRILSLLLAVGTLALIGPEWPCTIPGRAAFHRGSSSSGSEGASASQNQETPFGAFASSDPRSGLAAAESILERDVPLVVTVPAPRETRLLSILVSIAQPSALASGSAASATIARTGDRPATDRLAKTLHAGDPDALWTVRQAEGTELQVTLELVKLDRNTAPKSPVRAAIRVAPLTAPAATEPGSPVASGDRVVFEAEPNDSPETANAMALGETVYGLDDDRPYIPQEGKTTQAVPGSAGDWFVFPFDSDRPKLVFFGLDFVDRDVPPDLRIYQKTGPGKLAEYTRGIDPQSAQRERPPRPGANKFTTRVLTKGTYYVWVDACQPDYQLRTKVLDVPPYLAPDPSGGSSDSSIAAAAQRSIRTAMDFQLLAGDSWHANTPRKGHPLDRIANFHHETSTCVACHPTHFTTQSVLAAVKAGYDVEEPLALQFLTDRLANNPVPFHGHPHALWARMIPAPANVLGRLSTIVMDFENMISGAPHNNLHRGIAEFLKLYYDGRSALPPDESNGNNPVSRYKVASDSWRQLDEIFRRTGDQRYAATRDLVARLLPTGTPANTRDLAAQTIGICLIDPAQTTLKGQIESNVERLLALQRQGGHWSVKFDPNYPITEMQTGESLYALARAGLKPDHPAVRQGIVALLSRQQDFGGWFDINPYEQFRTPFRETQWALMALSAFYPNPKPRSFGWNGPMGPEPDCLRTGSPETLIRDLERLWNPARPELARGASAALGHELPLVRYAACRALGRIGDGGSIAPLAKCLGDESKVVRRAAAEAVRQIGNRLSAARGPGETPAQVHFVAELAKVLDSPDGRARRGATRVFAAHFRDLSQELTLADALLGRVDDPDPVVAMQAIKGLWRFWYWQSDPSLRNRIEDRFIAALGQSRHPWVRRNLTEALYIIGDDNIRYLYQNWVPSLASKESQRRATADQHATVNRLGAKYVAALEKGNSLACDGILRAMSEFFERPVQGGRIGNDLEPTLFYDEMVPKVAKALSKQMSDPDPTIRRLALQAAVTIRGYRSAEFARAVARRLGDPDSAVQKCAVTTSREFPLEIKPGKDDPALIELANELLSQPNSGAQLAALRVLGGLGPLTGGARGFDPAGKILARLAHRDKAVRSLAFAVLRSFPATWSEPSVRAAIARGLTDADTTTRVAAIRMAIKVKSGDFEKALGKALEDPAPGVRGQLVELIGSERALREDPRMLAVIVGAVSDSQGGVREKALQLIQNQPGLLANAAVENSLRELLRTETASERQREIARSLLATQGRASASAASTERLDLAYFQSKVLPIFTRLGEDGQNCLGCHRSHTVLRLHGAGKDGRWTAQAVRENYRSALKVVNLAVPAESLLVKKPTWEAAQEAEAQNDPTKQAHTGGVRFEKGSPEYQTLIDWINGARLPKSTDARD